MKITLCARRFELPFVGGVDVYANRLRQALQRLGHEVSVLAVDSNHGAFAAAEQDLGDTRIFNVGGGREISLLRLLQLAEETAARKARVDYEPVRKFDAPRILLDTDRAKQILGWQPRVPLREGLDQTWTWMSRNLKIDG